MTIFCDLDGVLADFIKAACPIFNTTYEELLSRWEPGKWDMASVVGISNDETFYQKIESLGADYWANVDPYPWRDQLWGACEKMADTYILTTPTYDPACLAGKLMWLQNWKGKRFRKYILAPHKDKCARWDRLLIDDRDENVDRFNEAGGTAILFPAHTNSLHAKKHDPLSYVFEEMEKWHKAMRWQYGLMGL